MLIRSSCKSHKLIDSALDEVHEFSASLGTLDNSLELVLDLFNIPKIWTSICVGKVEPCVMEGGGLLNKRN